jgi:RNA polymerase sigma-70 factor (ECF subfamily)
VRDVGPRLLAYVRSAYRGVLEPEDVVAEAFCRTAENVDAFLRCARPDLYLFMVGRNICRDALRRRAPLATPDERLNLRAAGGDEPARGVARDEEQRLLAAALDALPPAQREVVVLRVSSGMKFQEIAEWRCRWRLR